MMRTDHWFETPATELAVQFGLVTPLTSACLTLQRSDAERNPAMPVRHVVPDMVAADHSAGGVTTFFCRSSSSTMEYRVQSMLMDFSSSELVDRVSGDATRSPAECVQALAELPEHLRPTTFEALLELGLVAVFKWNFHILRLIKNLRPFEGLDFTSNRKRQPLQ